MYEIYVQKKFDAAHFLPQTSGKCAKMHGHSWKVGVFVKSETLEKGMVVDFNDVKKLLEEVVPDHSLLNDILPNPTAENLAKYFFDELKPKINGLTKVIVWESTNSRAAYFED